MGSAEKLANSYERDVLVGSLELPGQLSIPEGARGVVIFAHGSGSSRFSRRNQQVAEALQEARIGTLLFDLLTAEEEKNRQNVFDIEILADRLDEAKEWLLQRPEASGLPIGYFGASTGAGAALVAAANHPDNVRAVVSRGGRPDLAGEALKQVSAPTLLIVGGADEFVVELNKKALYQLQCESSMEIIPGATHLFPEPGALEKVSERANEWFMSKF